ncbi:DUF2974 domain-containing protein [Candidatus Saccharibacteria bacterium]|nr:DUF2974 domain-containing protein [Candidatus Saccharibacteria bacterium]
MKTLLDFLRENRDVTLEEKGWGELDILLVAVLAYAPVRGFTEERGFGEFVEEILRYKPQKTDDLMTPKVKEVAKILEGAKRYEEMKIENFDDVFNDATQFGAICCRVIEAGQSVKTIGFRGTNNSVIGWIENCRVVYQYPTITHILAIEYTKLHIKRGDKRVYLAGHSKGGNLAMVAGMEAGFLRRRRIRQIYNFDGPGLRREQFYSRRFQRIRRKLKNVIPEQSVVGTLFLNKTKKVVKSNEKGVFAHYPTSWLLNKELNGFIEGEQSRLSRQLHTNTVRGLATIDREQTEIAFETIFRALETQTRKKATIGPENLLAIVKSIAGMDKKTRKYLMNVLGCLIKFK